MAWVSNSNVPYTIQQAGSSDTSYNGKLYRAGGYAGSTSGDSRVMSYDLANDTYDQSLATCNPRWAHASIVVNGVLYLVGGYIGGKTATCQKYDIDTDTWSTMASMPQSAYYQALAHYNGYLYAFGGAGGNYVSKYSISGDSWTNVATDTVGYHSAVTVGDYIWLFGGSVDSNSVRRFDPSDNSWTSNYTSIPGAGVYKSQAVAHGTKVYIAGGSAGGTYSSQFIVYDTVGDSWTTLEDMPANSPQIYACCGNIDGTFVIMQGANAAGYASTNVKYDLPTLSTTNPGGDINPYKTRIRG